LTASAQIVEERRDGDENHRDCNKHLSSFVATVRRCQTGVGPHFLEDEREFADLGKQERRRCHDADLMLEDLCRRTGCDQLGRNNNDAEEQN
jgi:hypothetical protein